MDAIAVSPDKKRRIEYVDLLKGLTILWVVWFHMQSPDFVKFPIRMPLFFFISGIFFKAYPLKEFIRKKFNTLIVPFFFFYCLTAVYRYLVWGFFKVFSTTPSADFDYGIIFSLFEVFDTGTIRLNIPLWFVISLLIFQISLYCVLKVFKNRKFQIVSCALIAVILIYNFHSGKGELYPGLVNFCFYSGGFLFGKSVLSVIENRRNIYIYIALAILPFPIYMQNATDNPIVMIIMKDVVFFVGIICFILIFKYLSQYKFASWLKFWGKNSYVVLGLHFVCIDFWSSVYHVCISSKPVGNMESIGLLCVIIATLWCISRVLNRYVPILVGKKDLWKKDSASTSIGAIAE